jgi:hypothetical protein
MIVTSLFSRAYRHSLQDSSIVLSIGGPGREVCHAPGPRDRSGSHNLSALRVHVCGVSNAVKHTVTAVLGGLEFKLDQDLLTWDLGEHLLW